MTILSTVLAILRAIPTLKAWFDWFVAEYTRREIAAMKVEIRAAIRKAIDEQDQRDLERAMGSTKPGKPSDLPGVELVDDLPGVVPGHKGRG